ncbi:MAG: CoB--CoM heterodisulfide reductase iron-sulfur subunit B family protein [Clostridiales bacterium]|nr:CoB--CoM heterodisulfide reductase iron-sulfur subunit B family protein [Clostridiales bacterium]
MVFSYYPGCTLKTKAKDLDEYARKSAQVLGVTLEELPDWQCCGGVYPMAQDEIATRLSSVRALASSKTQGRDLITLCSACHHVIKRVNNDMVINEDIGTKVNNYLQLDTKYEGETNVIHYLEMLRDVVGFDEVRKKVVNPLTGKKIGAYYGCLLLRPSKTMQFDNPENPTIIENFIRAIGATPVIYPYRNECCGGYVTLSDNNLAKSKCNTIIESAVEKGADLMITSCPLCMYNLDANCTESKLPIIYFTEILAEALGVK